jgi:DNA-binding response OmpR family regulator
MRVLLIENDPGISSFIKIGLEYYDFIVDIESDCLSEENFPISRNYDVIILDIENSRSLDLELCKKVINDRNLAPVLILTSIDCIDKLVKCVDCRREEYLIKPFKFDDLLARLASISKTLS